MDGDFYIVFRVDVWVQICIVPLISEWWGSPDRFDGELDGLIWANHGKNGADVYVGVSYCTVWAGQNKNRYN